MSTMYSDPSENTVSIGQRMAEIVLREHDIDPVTVSLDTDFGRKIRELIDDVDAPVRDRCETGQAVSELPERIEVMILNLRIAIFRLLSR